MHVHFGVQAVFFILVLDSEWGGMCPIAPSDVEGDRTTISQMEQVMRFVHAEVGEGADQHKKVRKP